MDDRGWASRSAGWNALAIALVAAGCTPARPRAVGSTRAPAASTAPDLSPAAATALCAAVVEDESTLQASAAGAGGLQLPDGARADVLACTVDDAMSGEVVLVFVAVSGPDGALVASAALADAYEVPGLSRSYELGRLERHAGGVRLEVTQTVTIYPCTGDPADPCPPEVERTSSVATCTPGADGDDYTCALE